MFAAPRKFVPSVRYTEGITIYFRDKETIYASDGNYALCFQRWFHRSDYKSWNEFVYKAKYRYGLTMQKLEIIASDHESVVPMWIPKFPDVPEDIKVLPDRRNHGKTTKETHDL